VNCSDDQTLGSTKAFCHFFCGRVSESNHNYFLGVNALLEQVLYSLYENCGFTRGRRRYNDYARMGCVDDF
jgi:hypothetical protein